MRALPLLAALLLVSTAVLAQQTGSPREQVEVTGRFKKLGAVVHLTKELDRTTGEFTSTAHDESGRAVDVQALIAAEALLCREPHFKLHASLAQELARGEEKALDIVIWLHFDPRHVDHREQFHSDMAAGMHVDAAQALLRQRVADGNQIALARGRELLRRFGLIERSASIHAPVLFTTATPADIALLAECPEVDTLYLENKTGWSETDSAVATHRWNRVFDFGLRGAGMRVAVIEDNAISNNHINLNVAGWFNPTPPLVIQQHETTCASIINSNDAQYPGYASEAELLSGNAGSFSDANLTAATGWALTQGADVVSMSFLVSSTLSMVYLDRYVDYQVRFSGATFTKSAGNQGTAGCGAGTGPVTSPGLAWNNIAVGNVVDNDNSDWSDDSMALDSSWDDPVSTWGDRQKPELAAVGSSINAASVGGGFGNQGSGTSYAGPVIAGMSAALMQAAPQLVGSPEAVKAIMMAAAWHNIEGNSRLSECDGAGAINGLAAVRVVENSHYISGSLTAASFNNGGYKTVNVYLQGGDRARIVLCWDSNANSIYTSDVLNADLDITLFQGSNTIAGPNFGQSASTDNSYEILEFVPPVSGTYTVRINDFTFNGVSEPYGLAWSQHSDGRHARLRPWLPDVQLDDLTGTVIGNSAAYMDPSDPYNPFSPFVVLASGGINAGFDLPSGRHCFGNLDVLTQLLSAPGNPYFQGFTGNLDGSGSAWFTRLGIPDVPALAGMEFYLSYFTLDPSAPETIGEIGIPERVTLKPHATTIPACDDCSTQVILPFAFPFMGSTYTQCWINANGNITFNVGDTSYTESVAAFVSGPPRIAAFWTDLNNTIGGKLRWRSSAAAFEVEWVNVSEYGTTASNQNSVIVTLRPNGEITMQYRDCSLTGALVGIAPGGGQPCQEVRIARGHVKIGSLNGIYEHFTGAGGLESFNLDTNSSYRNLIRFKPSGFDHIMTVDGDTF